MSRLRRVLRAWVACAGAAIAALCLHTPPAPAADVPLRPSAAELGEQGRARQHEFKFEFELPEYADREQVKALAEQGRTRGIAELERLNQAFLEGRSLELDGDGEPVRPKAQLGGRLVVALSSSLPEVVLREYFAQLDGVEEAVVVLRGFIGGASTIKPTGIWMEKATRTVAADFRKPHRRVNIVIDPLIYRDLGIDQVPAVAWLPGVQDIRHCDRETYEAATVVFGVTSVESAVREINRNGGQVPESLAARLGGVPWTHK